MSSWGNYDNAANTPLWAVNASVVKNNPTHAAPTRANVTLMYANTTPNVYVQNETVGLFGVDNQEADVAQAHTGWVLRTVGQGGRAGRVQNEVLIALSQMKGPDGDAQTYANVSIKLTGPSDTSVVSNTSYANTATFTVTPKLTGNTAATLTYQWQVDNASGSMGWTDVANGTPANTNYSGGTTSTLGVKPADVTANTYRYRVVVTAADQGVSATSANATITVS